MSAIRVASIPAGHVYVRHLSNPDGADAVTRLPDPPPQDGLKVPGGWWPPVMLDANWIRANREAFDVFHVHFGFEGKTPAELESVTAALDAAGVPLVVTVHDLRNPHHDDVALHDAQVGVLMAHAAEAMTLTPGAAQAIEDRWGRTAEVLPHPHVIGRDLLGTPRAEREEFVVGLHSKSLRANMDVLAVAGVLCETVAELPGARARIDVHDEIFDPANHWYAPEVGADLRRLAAEHPGTDLRIHPYFSDDELWRYLSEIDVSVLAYRFGTHSGWLEACHDLGTTVLAPTCGFYEQQRPCLSYAHGDAGLDAESLADAVRIAYAERPAWQADRQARIQERRELAAAHEAIYRRLL